MAAALIAAVGDGIVLRGGQFNRLWGEIAEMMRECNNRMALFPDTHVLGLGEHYNIYVYAHTRAVSRGRDDSIPEPDGTGENSARLPRGTHSFPTVSRTRRLRP